MREQRLWARFAWVLVALSGVAEGDRPVKGRSLAADRQEADLVAPALAGELLVLREQNEQLQEKVNDLTVQLAEMQLHADQLQVLKAKMAGPDAEAGQTGEAGALAVIEVSRELALVVLEGGRADGLKAGLMLAVLQGDEVVAKVRVVDVREEIAGARIVRVLGDGYPQPGNRVVIWRTSME